MYQDVLDVKTSNASCNAPFANDTPQSLATHIFLSPYTSARHLLPEKSQPDLRQISRDTNCRLKETMTNSMAFKQQISFKLQSILSFEVLHRPCSWVVASKPAQAQSLPLQHDVRPWWARGARSTRPRWCWSLAEHVWPACRCWREIPLIKGKLECY